MKQLTKIMMFPMIILFATSCSSEKENKVVWVNSIKSECSNGVGQMKCISIHRGNSLENPHWELLYTDIEGFNFEFGYFQKIEIQNEYLDKKEVPADASSIRYILIKTLEKKMDRRIVLNDIWVSDRIFGKKVSDQLPWPQMEIDLSKMKISGTNGCNNYMSKIIRVTSSEIQFGNLVTTKKLCRNMEISDSYNKALSISKSYKLGNSGLTFFDKEGKEVLHFRKID